MQPSLHRFILRRLGCLLLSVLCKKAYWVDSGSSFALLLDDFLVSRIQMKLLFLVNELIVVVKNKDEWE